MPKNNPPDNDGIKGLVFGLPIVATAPTPALPEAFQVALFGVQPAYAVEPFSVGIHSLRATVVRPSASRTRTAAFTGRQKTLVVRGGAFPSRAEALPF
ncbi:MAG: hypothetical protein CM15mP39_08940 [Synechococcus sp.]|nr:MAG: hypothetical protein CM15mP39_08940 [Synechococcus sp.]